MGHHGDNRSFNAFYYSLDSEVAVRLKSFGCDRSNEWAYHARNIVILKNGRLYWSWGGVIFVGIALTIKKKYLDLEY